MAGAETIFISLLSVKIVKELGCLQIREGIIHWIQCSSLLSLLGSQTQASEEGRILNWSFGKCIAFMGDGADNDGYFGDLAGSEEVGGSVGKGVAVDRSGVATVQRDTGCGAQIVSRPSNNAELSFLPILILGTSNSQSSIDKLIWSSSTETFKLRLIVWAAELLCKCSFTSLQSHVQDCTQIRPSFLTLCSSNVRESACPEERGTAARKGGF